MADTHEYEPVRFSPVAGVLAFLLPGAGHVFLGQTRRGVLIGAGVLGLFFGGMFIGGLSVVDSSSGRLENRISFYGQALVGPIVIAIDRAHQVMFKGYDPATRRVRAVGPDETLIPPGDPRNPQRVTIVAPADARRGEGPPFIKSQGKVHEIGLLYTVIAGMMNFVVILDALFPGGRLLAGKGAGGAPAATGGKAGA